MIKLLTILFLFLGFTIQAQTVFEKIQGIQQNEEIDKASSEQLSKINQDLQIYRNELQNLNLQIQKLYQENAPEKQYQPIIQKVHSLQKKVWDLEESWQKIASSNNTEIYGLWFQPDTTIGQLIIDYGTQDFVYLMSPEISEMKLNVCSHLPIPRESWSSMLEIILQSNGIGLKTLNSFLKELYIMSQDCLSIQYITNKPEDLELFPPDARLCYMLKTTSSETENTINFLKNFTFSSQTNILPIGHEILIIATVKQVRDILKIYDFIQTNKTNKNYKIIPLKKISAKDISSILNSFFSENNTQIIELESIQHSILIIGSEEEISRSEEIIYDLENQIEDSKEKVIYWYNTKHSDAQELAETLSKVYNMMASARILKDTEESQHEQTTESSMPIGPEPVSIDEEITKTKKIINNNFIVDSKTGSIIMVVEQASIPKIKKLLKKIDVPKKMVSIDVILCEKHLSNNNNFGLNLLKIGSDSATENATSIFFQKPSNSSDKSSKGLLEFILGRKEGTYMPPYQMVYNFLLTQEDIQINANPSLLTVNQTPASIDLMDEISINTGAVEVANDNIVKDSFERKQYGIHIKITPTIHMATEEDTDENTNFITLKTDIVFDTQKTDSKNSRPSVFRRQIKNEVRIADGQSVILGGLHQKDIQDNKEGIPFLGEIPGIGKIFSNTGLADSSTEMFIFITPKIIDDPVEQLKKIQLEEMQKRPGDTPEYLKTLRKARRREKQRLFNQSIKMLFGRPSNEAHLF